MNAALLLDHYARIADASDAIVRLRRFVLDLAVRGKLIEQDAGDEPASQMLRAAKVREFSPEPNLAGWAVADVVQLLKFQYGKGLHANERQEDGPIPVFGSNGVVTFTHTALTENPAIIVGRKGSAGALNLCQGPSWTTDVAYFVEAPPYFSIRYLMLGLSALNLDRLGKGVKPGLSRTEAYALTMCVPPLAEQHRIVAKVDELMALCDKLEAARTEREAARDTFALSTLARLNTPDPETFADDARFTLANLAPLTTRADQIKQLRQTILNLAVRGGLSGGISAGRMAVISDFRKLQNGYAFKSEWFAPNGIRLLRNANVGHGRINWGETVHLPDASSAEYERFLLQEGDIVLTLDRPFIVTGTKVARVTKSDLPSLLLQRVGRFVASSDGLADDYLFLWINSPHFNQQIDPGRSNGVPHISSKQVEAASIFVPPLAEQHRIVAKVDELMALCDQLEASLTTGEQTRSRLLESVLHNALLPASEAA